jgi:hypothetical protein
MKSRFHTKATGNYIRIYATCDGSDQSNIRHIKLAGTGKAWRLVDIELVGRNVGSAPEMIALVQIPARNDGVDQGEQMIYTPTSTFDWNITNNTGGSSGAILGVGLQYASFMERYYMINDWPVYDTDVVLYGYNSENVHVNIQLIFEEVKLSKVGKLQSLARIAQLTREVGGTEGLPPEYGPI